MTITTAGLTDKIRTAIQSMHEATPKARERRIDEIDATRIARCVRAVLRQVRPDDVKIVIIAHGGFVPNSYKYRAEADTVRVSIDIASGDIEVKAVREHAQSRSHGQGNWLTARILQQGQVQGRRVEI